MSGAPLRLATGRLAGRALDEPRPPREGDHLDDAVLGLLGERLVERRARVVERLVGDRLGDVDEVDGGDLLRGRGPREPRQPERDQRDERDPQQHREHALRQGEVGEGSREDTDEPGREQDRAEHLRVEELVLHPLAHPRQRRIRVQEDIPPVRPEQDPAERDACDDPRDDAQPATMERAHTVTLLWYVNHSIAVTTSTAASR